MMSLFRSPSRPASDTHSRILLTLARCLPFGIALAVLAIELTPAHFMYTGPLLTAVPALAAVATGPRRTAAAVALALAISVTTAAYNQAWGTLQVYTNFLALALVSVASFITSSAVRAYRRRELDQVRRIAVSAQEVILRPVPERLGPVRAASLCLVAGTEAQVGGDLYEAVHTRYGVRMIVGDVRGKGLSAMRAVATALGAFRVVAHYEDDLVQVMNHCAAALRREVAVPGAYSEEVLMEGFTTALIAQVPNDEPVVQLVNRGHPPPLLLHEGRAQPLLPTSPLPPLGLEDLVPGLPEKPESHPFVPGDRLLLYTDGVIEARDPSNNFFPLTQTIESISAATPQECLHQLHQALARHTQDHLADDVAMLLADRLDEGTGRPVI